MGNQATTHVANIEFENQSLITKPVSSITSALQKSFPGLPFRCEYRGDGGVDFLIFDMNAFLSPEFGSFLDRIAAPLTMEQYMLIDFVPSEPAKPSAGYAATTGISISSMESFWPGSSSKEKVEVSIKPGSFLECVYQAPVPASFSLAA